MQKYFHERGRTHMEALEKIREKYGDSFRILTQKTVPASGIMGLFGKEQVEYSGYIAAGKEAREVQKIRDEENRTAILASVGKKPVKSASRTEVASEKDPKLNEVLQEIRNLQGQLAISTSPLPDLYPILSELTQILYENDFEKSFIDKLIERLRNDFSVADLEDRNKVHMAAAQIIASCVGYSCPDPQDMPRVFILVGPTGVGKTTTIAKLAAVHGLSGRSRNVRIITVDSFRIGARAQVETYGEIMGIPVSAVDDYEDLKAQIALTEKSDLVLVDTIGKSPRDKDRIEEMQKLLSACGKDSMVHLALSASTKSRDLREILTQFESFDYCSVIVTKLDETSQVGNVLSILSEFGASMSYMTHGQSVPVDIAVASPESILGMIKGLDFDMKLVDSSNPLVDLTEAWR